MHFEPPGRQVRQENVSILGVLGVLAAGRIPLTIVIVTNDDA
jgi:hypothetical protein